MPANASPEPVRRQPSLEDGMPGPAPAPNAALPGDACGRARLRVVLPAMTPEERQGIIRQLVQEGRTLSQVLDHLHREKGDTITYMDLRLLLSEMPDVKLPEKEFPKALALPDTPPPAAAAQGDKGKAARPGAAAAAAGSGKLSISVDQVPAPGSVLSGYARFSSGAKAHWFLDDLGRLGLEPELGTGKPTEADMKEFSGQLRQMLQQAGGPGV